MLIFLWRFTLDLKLTSRFLWNFIKILFGKITICKFSASPRYFFSGATLRRGSIRDLRVCDYVEGI